MDLNTFIIIIYCLIDDWLQTQPKYRRRGPQPTLTDSELLTIEVVGNFLGYETDKGLYLYFPRHYRQWFPALADIHRTTFVRQSANLWWVKVQLWRQLLQWLEFEPELFIMDSMPLPVCRFARANRCKRLQEVSEYGYDEVARQTYFGLRVHARIAWPGVICDLDLLPANVHDTEAAELMLQGVTGVVLADRNYWKPELQQRLAEKHLQLLAPYKSAKREKKPWPRLLKHKRYRIETVFGQLVHRLKAKAVWARDAWHLCSRWLRLILAHCFGVLLCQQTGLSPLRFYELVNV
jgi:hypothetical protein